MEKLTSVTGKRHVFSTPAGRSRARTRAARLGRVERVALAVAGDVRERAVRAATGRVAVFIGGASLFVLGSVNDFKLPL